MKINFSRFPPIFGPGDYHHVLIIAGLVHTGADAETLQRLYLFGCRFFVAEDACPDRVYLSCFRLYSRTARRLSAGNVNVPVMMKGGRPQVTEVKGKRKRMGAAQFILRIESIIYMTVRKFETYAEINFPVICARKVVKTGAQ